MREVALPKPGFIAHPLGAKKGWDDWPVSHRRRWLFAVFGARTLEARELQVQRLVEKAAERGQKAAKR